MPTETICKTVGELIEALKAYPADAVPFGIEPPFEGVKLVPQKEGVLICRTRRPDQRDFDAGFGKAAPAP